MINEFNQSVPGVYASIDEATRKRGFSMPSDILTCALLRTLAASKPAGKFLELGTGTGLSTSWILDGMDDEARLISLESNEKLLAVAENYLGQDNRLELIHIGGAEWISSNAGGKFDYIFDDTWPGKYLLIDEVPAMVNRGGFYIVDDLVPQPIWPEGDEKKVMDFIAYMGSRDDFCVTKQDWATAIMVAVKK